MTILMLDNFDSFTYNLVDYFRQLGCTVKVYRNTTTPEQLSAEDFDILVLSPGPSVPRNAGNLMAIIGHFYRTKPILGVCLGHQALIEFFGGTLANIAPVHGKSVPITHDGRGIFTGIEQHCQVARYHSWAGEVIPSDFEVTARSGDGVVMAVRHKQLPIEGIQFHPESVLSMKNKAGMRMLENVVKDGLAAGNRIYHALSQRLQSNAPLAKDQIRQFLKAVNDGQFSEDQLQILLVSLSYKLRESNTLSIFISVLTEFSNAPLALTEIETVDICGTGGSGLPRINTSTLVALLLAQQGLTIAKHGNRAAAGRFGSFNLLESLGVLPTFEPEQIIRQLDNTRLAFVFAPAVHPVFRHFAPIRAKIGVPSVFNVLGPLVNPFLPKRQFIGTAFADLMDVIFETGIRMGKTHLIVVRGWDGLDEISVSMPTRVLEYKNGKRFDYEIKPEDFGIAPVPFDAFSAASPEQCVDIARNIIQGQIHTHHHMLVAANAAFIYTRFVADIPLDEAYKKMEKQIKCGALQMMLEQYLVSQDDVAVPV